MPTRRCFFVEATRRLQIDPKVVGEMAGDAAAAAATAGKRLDRFAFVYGSAGVAVLCALGAVLGLLAGQSRHGKLSVRLLTNAPWVAAVAGLAADAARLLLWHEDHLALMRSERGAWGPVACYGFPLAAATVCFAVSFLVDGTPDLEAALETDARSTATKRGDRTRRGKAE